MAAPFFLKEKNIEQHRMYSEIIPMITYMNRRLLCIYYLTYLYLPVLICTFYLQLYFDFSGV